MAAVTSLAPSLGHGARGSYTDSAAIPTWHDLPESHGTAGSASLWPWKALKARTGRGGTALAGSSGVHSVEMQIVSQGRRIQRGLRPPSGLADRSPAPAVSFSGCGGPGRGRERMRVAHGGERRLRRDSETVGSPLIDVASIRLRVERSDEDPGALGVGVVAFLEIENEPPARRVFTGRACAPLRRPEFFGRMPARRVWSCRPWSSRFRRAYGR